MINEMEFEIRLLKSKEEYSIVEDWYLKWNGYPALPFDCLPKLTAICLLNNRPICAGGIYQTETPVCFVDNIVSDPTSNKDARDLGVNLTIRWLMNRAKESGSKYWSAHSKLDAIKNRSNNFNLNYSESNHYWMTGEL